MTINCFYLKKFWFYFLKAQSVESVDYCMCTGNDCTSNQVGMVFRSHSLAQNLHIIFCYFSNSDSIQYVSVLCITFLTMVFHKTDDFKLFPMRLNVKCMQVVLIFWLTPNVDTFDRFKLHYISKHKQCNATKQFIRLHFDLSKPQINLVKHISLNHGYFIYDKECQISEDSSLCVSFLVT